MFRHVKQLQYTVRVAEPNPGLANLLLEQFGDDDPGRKDMLMDIATEELSHLEIIGSLVGMLNKGAKGAWRKERKTKPICTARLPLTATTAILPLCYMAEARR